MVRFSLPILFILCAAMPVFSRAEVKVTSSDLQGFDEFGNAVAIDGNSALVAAVEEDANGNRSGAAYLFQRNAGGTNQWAEVAKLTASDAQAEDFFGISVALDGGVAVVGAHQEDSAGSNAGAAYVFERNAGGTNQWGEVKKLTASDPQAEAAFGQSVGVDGDVILAGAPERDAVADQSGAVYVFERHAGGSNEWGEAARLTPSDAEAFDLFGEAVAVAGDVVVAGASLEDEGGFKAGAAYVFERGAGGPNQWEETQKLLASDADELDLFGATVAAAGDAVLVGAPEEGEAGSGAGAAYVFERNAGGTNAWGEVRKLLAADTEGGDEFSSGVALEGDTAVIGARFEDAAGTSAGAAYVFRRNAGGTNHWGQFRTLRASDAQVGDLFGSAVGVDGNTVLVGAESAGPGGAAYLAAATEPPATIREVRTVEASDRQLDDRYGDAVAVAGDVAVIGAPREDDEGGNAGAAYILERNASGTNRWTELMKLTEAGTGQFGASVGAGGDVVLIGARGSDEAVLYERNRGGTNRWGRARTLSASDALPGQFFGSAVDVDGDVAVVGSAFDYASEINGGAAYLFERNAGGTNQWGEVRKLVPSDLQAGDEFGTSVAVAGDIVLVGAPGKTNAIDFNIGAAYIFERHAGGTNNWGQVAKLSPLFRLGFGNACSLDGSVAVVGDEGGSRAYVFERNAGGTNAWGEVAMLTETDAIQGNAEFGASVGVAGDVVAVGAPEESAGGNTPGVVYLFQRDRGGPNQWGEVGAVTIPSPTDLQDFGQSVSLSGGTLLAGAPRDIGGGSARFFQKYPFPEELFAFSGIRRTPGGDVVVSWNGASGWLYTVQESGGLRGAPTWTAVPGASDLPGRAGANAATNASPSGGEAFHRVIVNEP